MWRSLCLKILIKVKVVATLRLFNEFFETDKGKFEMMKISLKCQSKKMQIRFYFFSFFSTFRYLVDYYKSTNTENIAI